MAKSILLSGIFCILLAGCCESLRAQDHTDVQPSRSSTPGQVKGDVGLNIVSMTVSPQTRVMAGGILIIRVAVENTGTESARGYLVGRIAGQTGEEDRRRIEIGARKIAVVDTQLRVNDVLPSPRIEVIMSLNIIRDGREVLAQQGDEPIMRTLPLQVQSELNFTAVAMDNEPPETIYWRWPRARPYYTYELAVATRIDAGLTRQCIVLESEPLPLNLADWQCINTVIIANPIIFNDAATIGVLQQFLHNGGRVWVMLDSIDTESISDLLSENQQLQTVATVELNRGQIEVPAHSFAPEDRIVDSDDPLPMKRVIQHGGTVTHWVDGWPAAIWMNVGRGELLLTTLSSGGWLKRRETQTNRDPVYHSAYTMPLWAATFPNQLHSNKSQPPLKMSAASYPLERIGNPVVSRTLVSAVLIGFCISLIAFGVWRAAGGETKSLGLAAPALAIIACIPLVLAAVLQRRDIPSMVAALQYVQIEPQAGTLLREAAAVYSKESRPMSLIGQGDGIAIPSSSIESGLRAISTEDFQKWRMTNEAWPTGTWRYTSEIALPEKELEALGHFTEQGLSIDLPKDLPSPLQDIVVNIVDGAPTLGKLSGDKEHLLIDGQLPAQGERWTTDSIVSDEQRRRAAVYAKLFEGSNRRELPQRRLCGWTDLWPQAPQWDVDMERRGTALVTLPLRILTPQVGESIYVPYPLIQISHTGIQTVSPIFKQETGRFIAESTLSTEADLTFSLPPEVVPLEVKSLTVDWDIKAPGRTAKLIHISENGPVTLIALTEPSIPWTGKIDDERALKDLRDGRLDLRIEVAGSASLQNAENGFVSWRIKHLRLAVEGYTLPRNRLVIAAKP